MNWQLVIIFALCAILLAGYGAFSKHEDAITSIATTTSEPGFYMNNANVVETDKDGNPRFALHADTITQDVTHQLVQLEHVAVNYQGTTQSPWQLTAQSGQLQPDTRVVTFNGDVMLQPTGAHIALPIVLRTDQLSIDTVRNLAHAPGQVSITMNKQLLTAVGMQANLQHQTIRLESQVHGEFTSR